MTLSGKAFGTFTHLLQHPFQLLQLFRRDVLERTVDECPVPAKEWDEHFSSLLRQSYRSHPAIASALYAADKPFPV